MTTNTLATYDDDVLTHVDLRLRHGLPVGWAELDPSGTLAGTLGVVGAERIGRRLPVLFAEDDRDEVTRTLHALARRSPYFARACILLRGSKVVGRACVRVCGSGDPGPVAWA